MNLKKSCQILDITEDITEDELKRQYHRLISLTHPDSQNEHSYPYDAYEINEAYEYLLSNLPAYACSSASAPHKKEHSGWSAPINPNAYCERNIYQYYEDYDGNRIGTITLCAGRYTWIPDEDFSLFLKSLYDAAKKTIAENDEKRGLFRSENMSLMADIAYLLAGQFYSADTTFSLMKQDGDSYYAKTYLELSPMAGRPNEGDLLIPLAVRNHRLYVCNLRGNELGYLTFSDDRLLFGLIPLFERKAVQVKMTVNSLPQKGSPVVNLWVKNIPDTAGTYIDSINMRIEQLLNEI